MNVEIYQEIKWKIKNKWRVRKTNPIWINKISKYRRSTNFWIRQEIIKKRNSALTKTKLLKIDDKIKNGKFKK